MKGTNELELSDVLVGEVWFCSGQSNMQWAVANSNHAAVEIAAANAPQIRLLTVPMRGRQEPQADFDAKSELCSSQTVGGFSAVGYFFGRRLHDTLGVPIGLIDNSWGGSAAEAWVPREVLAADGAYAEVLEDWAQRMADYTDAVHQQKQALYEAWVRAGKPAPSVPSPWDERYGQHRPGNIYYGMLSPMIGYGIRGVIWSQGETNAGRASKYTDLMTMLIQNWRDVWGQGDFPFYWVQLADFKQENEVPEDTSWPYLREAQTHTLDRLENIGQAVAIDVGEGRDIHPRNKQVVANRLARLALANDYGYDMASQSPLYHAVEFSEGSATVRFEHIDQGLYSYDTEQVLGFTVAGEDMIFVNAHAEIVGKDQIKVWSDSVPQPVAVRYCWAMNPVCNLYDRNGLPVTPFRTDR